MGRTPKGLNPALARGWMLWPWLQSEVWSSFPRPTLALFPSQDLERSRPAEPLPRAEGPGLASVQGLSKAPSAVISKPTELSH